MSLGEQRCSSGLDPGLCKHSWWHIGLGHLPTNTQKTRTWVPKLDDQGSRYMEMGKWAQHQWNWRRPEWECSGRDKNHRLLVQCLHPWHAQGLQTTAMQLLHTKPISWGHASTSSIQGLMVEMIPGLLRSLNSFTKIGQSGVSTLEGAVFKGIGSHRGRAPQEDHWMRVGGKTHQRAHQE